MSWDKLPEHLEKNIVSEISSKQKIKETLVKKKENKYKNKECKFNGISFASKAEGYRYLELKEKESRGLISDLSLQPKFELIPSIPWNGKTLRKITYSADFQYTEDGQIVVEDKKGMRTDVYKIKMRLFILQNPTILFRES